VMYIGDEVRDIDAAKKAEVAAVSVTWGYNTEEVLTKNNPKIIIKTPSELSLL
jgi:phosphoglycolate phosphatase